jgi:hypothetical protein
LHAVQASAMHAPMPHAYELRASPLLGDIQVLGMSTCSIMRTDHIAKRRPSRVFSMSFSLLESVERKREDHRGNGDFGGWRRCRAHTSRKLVKRRGSVINPGEEICFTAPITPVCFYLFPPSNNQWLGFELISQLRNYTNKYHQYNLLRLTRLDWSCRSGRIHALS